MRLLSLLVASLLIFVGEVGAQATESAQSTTNLPSDVQAIESTKIDTQSIAFRWKPATDADGIIMGYNVYYGLSSVLENGGTYDDMVFHDSVLNTYVLSGLQSEETYYIAVTAIDDLKNESAHYSPELEATTLALETEESSTNTENEDNKESATPEGTDPAALAVISADQISNTMITVTMSRSIDPLSVDRGFVITNKDEYGQVAVIGYEIDDKIVNLFVESESLAAGKTYVVTARASVKDLSGQPLSSGLVDSAEFVARFIPPVVEVATEEVETEPEAESSEEDLVIIPDDAVAEDYDESGVLTDDSTNDTNTSDLFTSAPIADVVAAELDVTPPNNALRLAADLSYALVDKVAILSWIPALDADGDIADQIIMTSVNNGPYEEYSVGKGIDKISIAIKMDADYLVKLITVDKAGNESTGVVVAFSTKEDVVINKNKPKDSALVDSGPYSGGVVALLVLLAVGGYWLGSRCALFS